MVLKGCGLGARKTRTAFERRRYKEKQQQTTEAEAAFAPDIYRDRAALNRQAQELLATGLRQLTIRNGEIARAKQQAEAKGLRYRTHIKMLLHEALARNPAGR